VLAVYGGSSMGDQIRALKRGTHIIVATPGRMHDLLRRECARLNQVQRVVLDEADEMLDMGFQEELEAILKAVPENVRKLLFSATMSQPVAVIAGRYLRNPVEVIIGQRNAGSENVSHECYKVHAKDRYLALKRIIDYYRNIYGIVFCRTRAETQEVATNLMTDGYNADALHGDLTQEQRDRVMNKFRTRSLQLLVATDVAARGLDVNDLTHVINYNLPDEAGGYTHRSGRTGRAGKEGVSIAIVNFREEFKLRTIEQIIKKKFIHKPVPTGREVCESQLLGLMERLKQIDVNDRQIESFMPAVHTSLGEMPPAEVIKSFILIEFNRFLTYYKDAPDLNLPQSRHGGNERGHGRERPAGNMVKLEINLGQRNALTPAGLISVINRATRGPMLPLGRIRILENSSFFEIPGDDAPALITNLNRATYQDRNVQARLMDQDSRDTGSAEAMDRGDRGGRPLSFFDRRRQARRQGGRSHH